MNDSKIDCRALFRLHTLDLPYPCSQPPSRNAHWMLLKGSGFRRWVADLAREYGRLRRAGGDPFDGGSITGHAILRKLGFTARQEPQTACEHIKFTAAVVVAGTREAARMHREMMRLAMARSRP
jgi:hypothetical protein